MIKYITLIALALTMLTGNAEARKASTSSCIVTNDVMRPCAYNPNFLSGVRSIKVTMRRDRVAYNVNRSVEEPRRHKKVRTIIAHTETFTRTAFNAVETGVHAVRNEVIGGRPSGCPHAYCGCSASLKLFGKIIPELNLAANWGRFPSAAPAPGRAAYRSGHVFVILAVNSDGTVLAHDGNSGRGLTRIHTVSLRGYRVVNPHA